MKKIIALIAAALFVVSCQEEIPESGNNTGKSSTPGKLTATIVVETPTRVTYAETPELNLQPAWEIGDAIIGFDDAGNTYTLTVASVSEETATLEGTVPDGALHLIYKSGANASDISSKTLAIDYTAQAGDKTMPAVMLADGTVEDGSCHFAFTNAGAIIGISAVKGVPSGSTISKITVEGANLSAAMVALSGSALALTATEKADDAISVDGLNLTVSDAKGTLSAPVFVAVPASAKIAKVSVNVPKEPETMKKPSATPQEGVDYVTIAGIKWAKWNVGANTEKDYGWYFPWAGTEGYFRYADTWQLALAPYVEFSYTPETAHNVVASEYMFVRKQTFNTGHSFNLVNTPYQTQNPTGPGSARDTRYTKYLGSTSSSYKDSSATDADASKTVLDLGDDAAHVNWGGSWRMPTSAEFQALCDATYWAWDSTDNGYYVFSPDASHTAGTKVSSIPGGLSKDNALLFFPSAGLGNNVDFVYAGSNGAYFSSTLYSYKPSAAYFLGINKSNVNPKSTGWGRNYGMSVRPVLD